jgi:N-acetylglucosaminyldiphosphoundecaprenol N-acetyl-beta-D-mannosaminyltransferase
MAVNVSLLGIRLDEMDDEEALDLLESRLSTGTRTRVVFVNAHCMNVAWRDSTYRRALTRAELVFPDGSGILLASRLLQLPIRHNLNGTDLVPRLLERASRSHRSVFLVGAAGDVVEQVAATIRLEYPGLRVLGVSSGYLDPPTEAETLARIRITHPDLLLVARGVPLQEVWIDSHWNGLPVGMAIGVGGLFDFMANRVPRAPAWMRRIGLEWSFRLIQEPRRLWRRYLIGNSLFLARVVANVPAGRRHQFVEDVAQPAPAPSVVEPPAKLA